jgi:subtilisin family serine protease
MTEHSKISPSFDAFFEDHDPDAKHEALVIYHPPKTRQTEALSKSGRLRELSHRLAFIQRFAAEQHAMQQTLATNYHAEVSADFSVSTIGNNTLPVLAVEIEKKTLPVLADQPEVAAVIPNQRIQLIQPTNMAMKNLRPFEKQIGMTWGLRALDIPKLWELAKTKGQGVRVAVLDTGVDAEHPVLEGRVKEFSLIDPIGQRIAATPYFDGANHGTHVCGTIAGQVTEDGVQIGIAPACELLVSAILVGATTLHTYIEGVSWALEHGADIINMSFGTTYYEPRFDLLVQWIREVDVLPVVAIGNEQFGNSRTPGSSRYSLSVGAIGKPWQKPAEVAHFSSGVSFTFPGNPTQYITKPDVVAPGVEVYSCVPRRKDQTGALQPSYAYMDGTSMATPHVAGVAALLMTAKPSAPVDTIMEVLKATADHPDGAQLRPDNRWGYGIINPMNAYKAL